MPSVCTSVCTGSPENELKAGATSLVQSFVSLLRSMSNEDRARLCSLLPAIEDHGE